VHAHPAISPALNPALTLTSVWVFGVNPEEEERQLRPHHPSRAQSLGSKKEEKQR
jgi:hypothetical protein